MVKKNTRFDWDSGFSQVTNIIKYELLGVTTDLSSNIVKMRKHDKVVKKKKKKRDDLY